MREAGLLHDGIDSDAVDAVFAEQVAGGSEDALAGFCPFPVRSGLGWFGHRDPALCDGRHIDA